MRTAKDLLDLLNRTTDLRREDHETMLRGIIRGLQYPRPESYKVLTRAYADYFFPRIGIESPYKKHP